MDELGRIRLKKMRGLMAGQNRGAGPSSSFPSEPVHITDGDFDSFIQKYSLAVVDFWADWCPPCHAMAPVIEALAEDYAGKVIFAKLNVDENPRTATQFGIMSIPTLLIFKEGKLVDSVIGAVPRRHLEAKIKPYMDQGYHLD